MQVLAECQRVQYSSGQLVQCRLLPFNSAQKGGARLIMKSDDDAGGWQVRVKGHGGTSVNAANTHRTSQGFLCHG